MLTLDGGWEAGGNEDHPFLFAVQQASAQQLSFILAVAVGLSFQLFSAPAPS